MIYRSKQIKLGGCSNARFQKKKSNAIKKKIYKKCEKETVNGQNSSKFKKEVIVLVDKTTLCM